MILLELPRDQHLTLTCVDSMLVHSGPLTGTDHDLPLCGWPIYSGNKFFKVGPNFRSGGGGTDFRGSKLNVAKSQLNLSSYNFTSLGITRE